jgi:hypothetical protein
MLREEVSYKLGGDIKKIHVIFSMGEETWLKQQMILKWNIGILI